MLGVPLKQISVVLTAVATGVVGVVLTFIVTEPVVVHPFPGSVTVTVYCTEVLGVIRLALTTGSSMVVEDNPVAGVHEYKTVPPVKRTLGRSFWLGAGIKAPVAAPHADAFNALNRVPVVGEVYTTSKKPGMLCVKHTL